MNRDLVLTALGFGLGALVFTRQGRQMVNAMGQIPVVRSMGNQVMGFLKNMPQGVNNAKNEVSGGSQPN